MHLALADHRHRAGPHRCRDVVDRLLAAAVADEDELVVAVAVRRADRPLADAEAVHQHHLHRRGAPEPVDVDGLVRHPVMVTDGGDAVRPPPRGLERGVRDWPIRPFASSRGARRRSTGSPWMAACFSHGLRCCSDSPRPPARTSPCSPTRSSSPATAGSRGPSAPARA
jgi:hypothetical protein